MDASEFIKEFQRLYKTSPQISHWTRASENCDYGDIIVVSKSSYLCFWSANLENCLYVHESRKDRFCADLMFCEDCELCYECMDCLNCYNGNFLQDCKQSSDCSYSYGLIGASDCFGCAGLQRKQYYIWNKPYTRQEYFEKLKALKTWPTERIQEKFEEVKQKTPRIYMHQMDNENSYGDYLYHSKNSYWCFDSMLCEDSMYIYNANLERGTKDCLDCGPMINTLENCYDMPFNGFMFNCMHTYWCDYLSDCQWCTSVWNSNHCYGCVYLKAKEYLFLNQPIAKSEYETVTKRMNKELAALGIRDFYGLLQYRGDIK